MLVKDNADLSCCGIYAINCILTNKCYVGCSIDIAKRYKDHTNGLFKNKHTNKPLQATYNNHPESFYFELLEVCDLPQIREKENFWIKEKDSVTNGFNVMQHSAHNSGGLSKKRQKQISEAKKNKEWLEEFYECMSKLSLYKDKELSGGVYIGTRGFSIVPKVGKLQPKRLAKFGRMILRVMDEVYTLQDGSYKLGYVNYIASEGRYDIWEYEPKPPHKKTPFTKARTNQIYDRFVDLIMEDLSWSKLGEKCIKELDKLGIELRRYDPELITELAENHND